MMNSQPSIEVSPTSEVKICWVVWEASIIVGIPLLIGAVVTLLSVLTVKFKVQVLEEPVLALTRVIASPQVASTPLVEAPPVVPFGNLSVTVVGAVSVLSSFDSDVDPAEELGFEVSESLELCVSAGPILVMFLPVAVPVTEVHITGFFASVQLKIPFPVGFGLFKSETQMMNTNLSLVSTLPNDIIVFVTKVRSVGDHRVVDVNPTVQWVSGKPCLSIDDSLSISTRIPLNVSCNECFEVTIIELIDTIMFECLKSMP